MRSNEYRQLHGWVSYESLRLIPLGEGPLRRGGGPHKEGAMLGHESPTRKTQKAEGRAKTGIIGCMYPHIAQGMAPVGGEGPPPPGGGGLPEDKLVDEMEGEEDDEGDTDEETVSVASSSQDSADKIRYRKWGKGEPVYRSILHEF